ncbi:MULTISPECIES: hypothetical protein [unclassified Streptomyces]|uniref:hypothetical protein n=1 Tax=unclassified Streptomyces TaxID=2593676 RepID=UPI002E76DFC3|nr:hypothetical protein [Streptomyces sp. JV184]MEE1747898.1 hypothetical protein [Streptomyces sp. JV184]
MYAFGLCTDQNHLPPGLVTIAALALRSLTTDLAPAHTLLPAHFAKPTGFGSIGVARCTPLRASRMTEKASR